MLIESFLDYLQYERNYSEKTVLAYGEDIKQLQEFAQEEYGKFNPLEVEAELIREWIVSLMDKGYTSTSVNRKLSSLRTFYKYPYARPGGPLLPTIPEGYTVCQHFGLDTSDYSFGYVAGWSSGKEMTELKASLRLGPPLP